MNYTPYEIKILLEVHNGMTITTSRGVPIFTETMASLINHGLVRVHGYSYAPGQNLPALIAHVLGAPRPKPVGSRPRLTSRQSEIFDFVKSHTVSKGIPPTRVEIAECFGFNSPNAAEDHLRALEKKGYIKLGIARARSIQVIA